MTTYKHLRPEVAKTLTQTKEQRIEACRKDVWIGYPAAHSVLERMDRIYTYPKTLRMPNLLVVGEGDNGKSSILEHFVNQRKIEVGKNAEHSTCVLRIVMPSSPTESSFWSEVLWAMLIGHRDRDPPERKRRQVYETMEYVNVRALAIDEFNHLSNAGKDAARLLAALKNLSNALRIPIIATGTDACINALNSDIQMKTRFQIVPLESWVVTTDYARFLATYESLLPLALPSNLGSREVAHQIYGMAGRTLGGTVRVLKEAAERAIITGREQIDSKILASLNFVQAGQFH